MQNAKPQNTEYRTAIGRTVTESVQKKKGSRNAYIKRASKG